ncbi:MAG: glycosyltransferase family 4 protein [Chloroflexi bacterium]|nr:glycosyltransferase family 4 protein [Chloroflexota bacterium]
MSRRALFVVHRAWPAVGGSERAVQETAERLAQQGWRCIIYTTSALDLAALVDPAARRLPPGDGEHRGVRIRRFPIRYLPASPIAQRALRRVVAALSSAAPDVALRLARWTPWVPDLLRALGDDRERFDLVHVSNVVHEGFAAAALALARRQGARSMLAPYLHLGDPADSTVRRFYTLPHQVALLRAAGAVLAQTPREQRQLVALGVDPGRVHLTGVGVTPEEVTGGDADRLRRLLNTRAPLVLFVGVATYDKGALHLLQAMERLWQAGANADLVLAGEVAGDFAAEVGRLPSAQRTRCHVLGVVDDETRRDLLAGAALLALPSRTESFGIVLLEAWACGLPVVAAAAGGIPDVVDDGVDGLLIPFGDVGALTAAIRTLLEDPQRRAELGARGRAKVLDRLTWDHAFTRVQDVIQEVFEPRKAARWGNS